MRQLNQTWPIGQVGFHLVEGDLFEVPVDAIVNSEQTDFYLAGNPNTISGQIYRRFGAVVQEELDDQTHRQVLPVGTVLSTRAGTDNKVIYHVGFHEPGVYPTGDDDETEYLHVLRRCVRKVLDLAVKDGLNSVAFPLIGTGQFGLDPSLLAYEFMAEVSQFANDSILAPRLAIWLVVRGEDFAKAALDGVVQALIDRGATGSSWEAFNLGVSYLDLFEQHCARSDHPTWSAWQLCRYCELLTGFIFYNLASCTVPPAQPKTIFQRGKPFTFGSLRMRAASLAQSWPASADGNTWQDLFVTIVAEDSSNSRRLQRINHDRNDIAHGRRAREASEIRADFCDFLHIWRWRDLAVRLGPPHLDHLVPWLHNYVSGSTVPARADAAIAILDQWDNDAWWYLVPHTGNLISVSRYGQ